MPRSDPRASPSAARRGLHACAIALLAFAFVAAAVAQPPPGRLPGAQVLVITGSDPYLPAFVSIDGAMRAAVGQERQVHWLYESLDALRFGAPVEAFADAVARKYDGIRLDAIVLVTEPAVDFYLRHGARLWSGVPAVFSFVPPVRAQALRSHAGLTGLAAEFDFAQTLRIAFALQPAARRLLLVAGASPLDQDLLAQAQASAQSYSSRVAVEIVQAEAPAALARRLAKEPADTIVLYVSLLADAQRRIYVSRDVLSTLAAASSVPLYGAVDTYMGMGATAGAFESFTERGGQIGQLVLRALRGERDDAPVPEAPLSRCVADGRELARHRLDRARLPGGCEVRYEQPSLVRQYWWQLLLLAAALAAQTLLIGALLVQRRRRRAAEIGYAAQRTQLLHASRLAVAGELTASIAHEINQPLAAILSNADAAEMLLQAGRANEGELLQILADIKRDDLRASEVIRRLRALLARHEVERRPFDMNTLITDTVAMLGAETRRRSAIVETALHASRCTVSGDRVQIQQVVINLILNALDASAALPAGERRVVVATADADAGLQVSVRDVGAGIAPEHLPRIFDSFFSTKSSGMGLGLAIARSIVEAHDGTIAAVPLAAGTEFRVTLPIADQAVADPSTMPETP